MHGTHAECSPACSHLFEVGEESQMLFFEVSSILLQYYTQRFGVTGWARAHPGKSITRSSGSFSSFVVLARQLTGFQISAHCTQPSSEQATMLADVPKQACVPLKTTPKTAAPGLASSSDWLTVGVMSAPTAARIERLSADQKNAAARKENGIFFSSQIAHAIQFKGTVQLVAAKSRQALMSWRTFINLRW